MDAARVLALIAQLRAQNIPVWIDGGWAIDALLETQTRPHDDLDLVARLDDTARIERVLGRNGYYLAGGGFPSATSSSTSTDIRSTCTPCRSPRPGRVGTEWWTAATGSTPLRRSLEAAASWVTRCPV
jgi:hypothetical protein